ncbi:hypothetical protein SeMB42_g02924 [Synchytrium endobioticum]|uniref:RING-type E3 ubiquitin transferase n=1 Tax=Synchytrium endobioticum TaxID=286115 RepID=A0A507D4L5_9FUNG|nr:hypothetical protein SeLEV6574_g03362 [Synchytrium endobioticum]TPX48618.1 hypothetical protein SeMB42_g02924 [Synchytrium endobioticum]
MSIAERSTSLFPAYQWLNPHDLLLTTTHLPLISNIMNVSSAAFMTNKSQRTVKSTAVKNTKRPDSMTGKDLSSNAGTNDVGNDIIDPDFRCPVCLEWLMDPITFDCHHSICHECLQKTLESAFCKGVCPICRHRVLSFLRQHAHNPEALINHKLAATIAKKRAEYARRNNK